MSEGGPGTDAGWGRRFRWAGRAGWWAVLRTERDRRRALAAGRPLTARNLWRLLMRRFSPFGAMREGPSAMDDAGNLFDQEFQILSGNGPYPWQRRLFERLVAGRTCDALDIPTGLGKTSVISIWLLACLHAVPACRPPIRLVYVVNRRTIVDQASDVAEALGAKIASEPWLRALWATQFGAGEEPMAVSTLRGAKADNGAWLLAPHRPSIVVGTVDMIGSRLLFNAYRAGRWQRSRHAGLLGQDTLLVHDEAHLSEPFQELLAWIVGRQKTDGSPRPMKLLAMSATASTAAAADVLALDDEDRRLRAVQQRLRARKALHLHPAEKNVPAQLARLAFGRDGAAARLIVFVREPATASKVVDAIKALHKERHGEGMPAERIEMLTGTIRGYERDRLVHSHVLRELLGPFRCDQTVYLVATSAGEVGADFDADHMVCDLTTIDSFIQRAGRVNRRGEGDARIDLVKDVKAGEKLPPHQQAMVGTAELLTKLPDLGHGLRDASPQALRDLKEAHPAAYAACRSPRPATVTPHDVTLDAWALTSIHNDWPLAHEVESYLHGLDPDAPQTTVAWRAELDVWLDELHADGEALDAAPPTASTSAGDRTACNRPPAPSPGRSTTGSVG